MGVTTLVLMFAVVQCVLNANGQQEEIFFRKDYTYIGNTASFYKVHTQKVSWQEAKERCELEGAALYYPENYEEASAVAAYQNKRIPNTSIYIGISDLLSKGAYTTVDGQPVGDMYTNWSIGNPDNSNGNEDCVEIRKDGTMNDMPCHFKLPFICKKALKDVQWNEECHMPRKDYVYNSDFNRCYKVHTAARNWTEAFRVCSAEMSYLAVINSEDEADFLVQLSTQSKDKAHGSTKILEKQVLLGFHNKLEHGWQTVKGDYLEESGYSTWSTDPKQPDGGDSEKCGSMFYEKVNSNSKKGTLNDVGCSRHAFFVCEHEIPTLSSEIDQSFQYLMQ